MTRMSLLWSLLLLVIFQDKASAFFGKDACSQVLGLFAGNTASGVCECERNKLGAFQLVCFRQEDETGGGHVFQVIHGDSQGATEQTCRQFDSPYYYCWTTTHRRFDLFGIYWGTKECRLTLGGQLCNSCRLQEGDFPSAYPNISLSDCSNVELA